MMWQNLERLHGGDACGVSPEGEVVTSTPQRGDVEERRGGGQAGGHWGPLGATGGGRCLFSGSGSHKVVLARMRPL